MWRKIQWLSTYNKLICLFCTSTRNERIMFCLNRINQWDRRTEESSLTAKCWSIVKCFMNWGKNTRKRLDRDESILIFDGKVFLSKSFCSYIWTFHHLVQVTSQDNTQDEQRHLPQWLSEWIRWLWLWRILRRQEWTLVIHYLWHVNIMNSSFDIGAGLVECCEPTVDPLIFLGILAGVAGLTVFFQQLGR